MAYSVTQYPPPHEPVTLEQLRAHCRVDDPAQDSQLASLATAARYYVEGQTGTTLVPSLVRYSRDYFPRYRQPIDVPTVPLIQVESITYGTDDGDVVMPTADYVVHPATGRIVPTEDWPTTGGVVPRVTILYWAGHANPFTVVDGLIVPSHGSYRVGDAIQFSAPATLPSPLDNQTVYYVVSKTSAGLRVGLAKGDEPLTVTNSVGTHWLTATPETAKLAALMLAGHWFERPEAIGSGSELPYGITALIESLRTGREFLCHG